MPSNINVGGLPPGHGGVPPGQAGHAQGPGPQGGAVTPGPPQAANPPQTAPAAAPAAPAPPADGFRTQAPPAQTGQAQGLLTGNAQGPAQAARDLVAPDLRQLQTPTQVKERFTADYTAVSQELLHHPDVDRQQTGTRANEFFTQYARRFVETAAGEPRPEQPPPPEDRSKSKLERLALKAQREEQAAQERPVSRDLQQVSAREFAEALRDQRFDQLVNVKTGKDGVDNAFQLLSSEDLKEFEAQAANQEIVIAGEFPPPGGEVHDALPPPELSPEDKQEIGESPAELDSRFASERLEKRLDGPGNPAQAQRQEAVRKEEITTSHQEDEDGPKTRKRLGRKMLWNVLHTFRRDDESIFQAEEKWNRAAVAALLFMLFVAMMAVALVAL